MATPLTKDKWRTKDKQTYHHFYIRRVPDDLHIRWKALASFLGVDMRDVALESIDVYVSLMEMKLKELRNKAALKNIAGVAQ